MCGKKELTDEKKVKKQGKLPGKRQLSPFLLSNQQHFPAKGKQPDLRSGCA
jgi:hypothetical protein